MILIRLFFYYLFLLIAACSSTEAPIVDGWKQNKSESSDYRAEKGDTVYSIAWAFAMDYRQIVKLNNLHEPYSLHPGQKLHLSSHPYKSVTKPIPHPLANTPITSVQRNSSSPTKTTFPSLTPSNTNTWVWPTKGRLTRGFSPVSGGNKGIDISGKLGQPVVAVATGKVVYTGASLPGYGNLIILKHTDNALSAYAFNKVIAVKEGQMVKTGQTIATMGKNEAGKAVLHFEIREGGKPVDPMPFLPRQ